MKCVVRLPGTIDCTKRILQKFANLAYPIYTMAGSILLDAAHSPIPGDVNDLHFDWIFDTIEEQVEVSGI